MADILIIGGGPAGVSAAIYAVRAGINTTIVYKDFGALDKAHKIENYYGFKEPKTGPSLGHTGIEQAERLGAIVRKSEVVGLSPTLDNRFMVETTEDIYKADVVVLATGASHTAPSLKNYREYESKGISYCAVCDAFFYRWRDVAVLGSGEYALHEARVLQPIVGSVTVLTNGAALSAVFPDDINVNENPIAKLTGDEALDGVIFGNGESIPISGLFVAVGVAGSVALAQKIGAMVSGTDIVVDKKMRTNVPGLFAAGDCTGNMRQIAKAVYEGAVAGTAAIEYVRGIGA